MAAVLDAPAPPAGTHAICLQEPESPVNEDLCPVIEWGEATYWPLSYLDNRAALCLVAYETGGGICGQWELPGARYVVSATVEAPTRAITFVGQGSATTSVAWATIAVQPPVRPQPFWILNAASGQALTAPADTGPVHAGPVQLTAPAVEAGQLWLVDPVGHAIATASNAGTLALEGFADSSATLEVAAANPQSPNQRCAIDRDGRIAAVVGTLAATAMERGEVTIEPKVEPPIAAQQWALKPYVAAPDLSSDQLPALLPGQSFALTADGSSEALLAVAPESATAGTIVLASAGSVEAGLASWARKPDGTVVNVQSGLALTASGAGVVASPPAEAAPQRWALTAEGFLVCPGVERLLDASGGQLALAAYDPLQPPAERWQLQQAPTAVARAAAAASVRELAEPPANVTKLTLTAKISSDWYSGTTDTIYVSIGWRGVTQLLFVEPSAGESKTITIDLAGMFGRSAVNIGEIDHIAVYQDPAPHPVISDAFKLASVLLIADDAYTNYSFQRLNKWLDTPVAEREVVWSSPIPWGSWLNASQQPVDLDCQTYSVGLKPWIGDIKEWRSYNPAQIAGVGQLLGVQEGRLIGEQLMTQQCEELRPTDESHTYTWVYTPEGSVIYKWWDHNDRSAYIRHSQLGSGRPVICAGELQISAVGSGDSVETIIAMVNDASGHYKPDGGSCLWNLARKLQELGIPTDGIQWYWKEES
jgi:hypothetical protein